MEACGTRELRPRAPCGKRLSVVLSVTAFFVLGKWNSLPLPFRRHTPPLPSRPFATVSALMCSRTSTADVSLCLFSSPSNRNLSWELVVGSSSRCPLLASSLLACRHPRVEVHTMLTPTPLNSPPEGVPLWHLTRGLSRTDLPLDVMLGADVKMRDLLPISVRLWLCTGSLTHKPISAFVLARPPFPSHVSSRST